MARVLVTGAAGFIGSHVSMALLKRGDSVVGVDNFNSFYDPKKKEENAALLAEHKAFSLVRGTLLDESVRNACFVEPFDVVIHLAAWAGVRPSIEKPALYQKENIEGTVALMDSLRASHKDPAKLPRFVFASSSSVYGANKKVPFSEDDPVEMPVSPYAATKRCGELLAYSYHHLYGMKVSCLRFFTVYGPRQRPEMAIHKFAQLIADGKPVPMFGDGSTARDYTYIDDIVQGVLAAADRCSNYHIYNLGGSRTIRLDALVDLIGRALDMKPLIEHFPEQPGDVPLTFADITRAKRELDYHPDYPIERGMEHFAKWFLERRRRVGAT